MKPSVAAVRKIGGRFGFLDFKKRLMAELGVQGDPMKWDVPQAWQDAFLKSQNRNRI